MSQSRFNDPRNLGRFGHSSTPSPFYTIANQFVPRNFHDVIRWSRFITTQSPTITEVIRKFATYPITEFEASTDNKATKEKYKEIIKSIRLKSISSDVGINYYTIGNDFVSVYFPIIRNLECSTPGCGQRMECGHALRTGKVAFKNFRFQGTCPKCNAQVNNFKVRDTASTSIDDMNLIQWPAEHMKVNHNPITGATEYWYNIPNDVKRRIMMGDPTFISTIPMEMIEAVKKKQAFLFDEGNIYHIKGLSMGNMIEGMGMPPILSLYSSVFHQMLLKRANEAVASEHMTPMRVVYPNQQSSNGDPIAMMSLQGFVGKMEQAFKKHKQDPNHLVVAPIPIGYQNIGGNGRALLVSQELQFVEESILMGLGVSRELLSGTTNWTSSTVGLRLLENTLHTFTSQIEEMANWVMHKIAGYLNIEKVEVTLKPFQLTDDESLKNALPQFMEAGLVSPSTTLSAFGMDLTDELDNSKKDAVNMAVASADKQQEVRTAAFMKSQELNDEANDDSGYKEVRKQAYQMAAQIIKMPDAEQRADYLFSLKAENPAMYEQVDTILDEYMEMVRKQSGQEVEDPDSKNTETKGMSMDEVDSSATAGNQKEQKTGLDATKVKSSITKEKEQPK